MGRPQLVPYEQVSACYISAVERGAPPTRTCATTFDVPYERMSRRIEDLRLRGWLPPGPPLRSAEWIALARENATSKMQEARAETEARAARLVARSVLRAEEQRARKLAQDRRRLERQLVELHERRARAERRAQLAAERAAELETQRQQGRLAREATWRTHDEWVALLWSQIDVGALDECWPWTGRLTAEGYGKIGCWAVREVEGERGGKRLYRSIGAHRAAWITLRGEIEPGLTIDHVCHNVDLSCDGGPTCLHRRCCNPNHLEPVPTEVNSSRGRGGINFRNRTHCSNGHDFAVHGRLYANPSAPDKPWRQCQQCIRDRNQRAWELRKALNDR